MFTKEELNKKKDPELAAIAEELGLLLVPENTGKATYIKEILQAQEEDAAVAVEIIPDVDPLLVVEEAPVKEKRFRISVSNQEGVENTAFVKVGVNGQMYTIPRETEVIVPASVVEVLNNAIVTRFIQEGRNLVEQKARRFPFSVLGEVK